MSDINPYATPEASRSDGLARPSTKAPLSISGAFSIIIASAIGFGTAGTGIGYGLGVVAPSYYRGVFKNGNDLGFDPVQVGLGLGLTQGLVCGVLVGIVVILAVSLSRRRGPDRVN